MRMYKIIGHDHSRSIFFVGFPGAGMRAHTAESFADAVGGVSASHARHGHDAYELIEQSACSNINVVKDGWLASQSLQLHA